MEFTDKIRLAVEQSGETRYAISKATGIAESVLSRFMSGRSISGPNLDVLARHLGLDVTANGHEVRPQRKRRSR
ncbi:MAG: helix-turn-helix transcriptional regulator [Phycisphaerales bacterium]